MQKDLTTFLQEKESPGNWLNIANMYHLDGTNKQKSDYVRRLWKSLHKPMFTRKEEGIQRGIVITENVLVIGDIHEPFCKPGYLAFGIMPGI